MDNNNETNWVEFAKQKVAEHGKITADEVRALNASVGLTADKLGFSKQTFSEWFAELKTEVEQLPENIKTFFDLGEGNASCWRDHYNSGDSPQDAVKENIDDLARMQ
jgi:hypothetical protein